MVGGLPRESSAGTPIVPTSWRRDGFKSLTLHRSVQYFYLRIGATHASQDNSITKNVAFSEWNHKSWHRPEVVTRREYTSGGDNNFRDHARSWVLPFLLRITVRISVLGVGLLNRGNLPINHEHQKFRDVGIVQRWISSRFSSNDDPNPPKPSDRKVLCEKSLTIYSYPKPFKMMVYV